METHTYTILALMGRYILAILCFLVFVQAILEIRKAGSQSNLLNLASLEWKKKRIIFELAQENIVGRANSCDVAINSPTVMRRHFKLYLDCGEWIVAPYKKSEVYINNHLIEDKMQVTDNDTISFGKEKMIFNITPDDDEDNDA